MSGEHKLLYLNTVKLKRQIDVRMRTESLLTNPIRIVLIELFICGRLRITIHTILPVKKTVTKCHFLIFALAG